MFQIVDHLNGIYVSLSDSERSCATQTSGGLEYLLQGRLIELFISLTSLQ